MPLLNLRYLDVAGSIGIYKEGDILSLLVINGQ
jgi:hypothetical protein